MSLPWLVQFPQAREAPDPIRRALRELDPSAEVIYLGPRRWLVGRVRPTTEATRIAGDMLRESASLSGWARNSQSRRYRVALAMLGLQGFRPVTEYTTNDLDSRVVRDFQESQWRMRHTSDDQLFREIHQPDEDRKRAAAAEMRDRGRAIDAHKHAFTSNFGRGVSSVTNADVDIRSSVRTRHVIPNTIAS